MVLLAEIVAKEIDLVPKRANVVSGLDHLVGRMVVNKEDQEVVVLYQRHQHQRQHQHQPLLGVGVNLELPPPAPSKLLEAAEKEKRILEQKREVAAKTST